MTATAAVLNSNATAYKRARAVPESDEVRGTHKLRYLYWARDVRRRPDLSPAAKLVATALADFANGNDGACHPSRVAIADALGWLTQNEDGAPVGDARKVKRPLAELKAAGLVLVKSGNGRNVSRYELRAVHDAPPQRGQDSTLRGVTHAPSEGSPEPPVTTNGTAERTTNSSTGVRASPTEHLDQAEPSGGAAADSSSLADELAEYVEAETGMRPTCKPEAAKRLGELLDDHGGTEFWERVDWALGHQQLWREAISENLGRFAGGFDAIGRQMTGGTPSGDRLSDHATAEGKCIVCEDRDGDHVCDDCNDEANEAARRRTRERCPQCTPGGGTTLCFDHRLHEMKEREAARKAECPICRPGAQGGLCGGCEDNWRRAAAPIARADRREAVDEDPFAQAGGKR